MRRRDRQVEVSVGSGVQRAGEVARRRWQVNARRSKVRANVISPAVDLIASIRGMEMATR